MNISKEAWHYSVVKEVSSPRQVPQDICRYMRNLAGGIIMLIGVTYMLLSIVAILLAPLIGSVEPVVVVLSMLAWCVLGFILVKYVGANVSTDSIWGKVVYTSPAKDSLLSTWFTSIKEKTCMHITFD